VTRSDLFRRSTVPAHFPQFRNAAALAHLAHLGRGPRYVVVGGIAWYDRADIDEWLESKKKTGPIKSQQRQILRNETKTTVDDVSKRGRPTKLEQMRRRRNRGEDTGNTV
jgi:hypothetical protein